MTFLVVIREFEGVALSGGEVDDGMSELSSFFSLLAVAFFFFAIVLAGVGDKLQVAERILEDLIEAR